MAHRRAITVLTAPLLVVPVGATVMLASSSADAATPTYYNSQAAFQADVTYTVTDDYSNGGYMFIQNNATMDAVVGETDYFTTGFDNLNIVSGGYYCAGCNGSFELSFQTTSVGNDTGVNGVGVDIVTHDMGTPYFAFITFGDGTTADIALPASGNYWAVSAPERIERIHFGLSMAVPTTNGSFGIDNLTVGDYVDLSPCGDGLVQDDECDDMGESATCDVDCTFAACGDGTFNVSSGEACDTGGATATCNADCTVPVCGDGVINSLAGEACDDAGETATCNIDCTLPVCGDDVVNTLAGEECDDGAQSPACDADCTLVVCGDGIENNTAGEYCDDGNNVDGDGCSATCTNEEVETTGDGDSSSGEGSSSDGGGTTDATGSLDDTGTTGDTGDDSSGGDDGAADTSGGGSEDDPSATATDPDSATASVTDADGESSSGTDSGGANDSGGGCGCSTDDDRRRDPAWLVMAVLGIGALRTHSRRRPC